MLLGIIGWLLVGLLVAWFLLQPLIQLSIGLFGFVKLFIQSNDVDLKKKFGDWAVVTGSTDGIGKAYAKELASRGLNLVLVSRNLEKLEATKKEILESYSNVEVRIIVADFAKGKEIYEKIASELKDIPVGILVNNVGKNYDYPMYVGEVPENVLWDIININIGAVTMMTRIVIGDMKQRGRGAIVNIGSGSENQPLPLMTVYAATKVYVRSFTDALRAEYSSSGITIQKISPFFVSTKMNDFSDRLQISSIFVPNAATYAKNAVSTLGKVNDSTGYWAHAIQYFFAVLPPVPIRTKIGQMMNQTLRADYFKQKASS